MRYNNSDMTKKSPLSDTNSIQAEVSLSGLLRRLPSVNRLLDAEAVRALQGAVPPALLVESARQVLEQTRRELQSVKSADAPSLPSEDVLANRVAQEAIRRHAPTLQAAINATGIVLHTGLGRARLAVEARQAIMEVAANHSMVEIERETGKRGSRRDHVRGLLCELTGAEDATVVNNCAGAVFLAVTALAMGKEVIISRGELVEIGGAFRMPDIIRASGATLVEVGTTNRTRLSDYENAITERTGLILRCSPSNFALVGFTEETPTAELAALGRRRGFPVLDDQGSGAMLHGDGLALPVLPGLKGTLRDSVASGSDVVMASGDKLMGGPQAGLILGKKEYIERIAAHPLARALRVDKFTLTALEATLRLYRDPAKAVQAIPTLRYLSRTEPELRRMAQQLRHKLRAVLPPERFALDLVSESSQVGGGSLPGENLPTICVRLRALDGLPDADEMARRLRLHTPAVFARIKSDAILFDPRTCDPVELVTIAEAARSIIQG